MALQMKTLVLIASALVGASAFADGFVCENLDANLRIKAYNHTQAEEGTRVGATMIVSDPSISHGRSTIATFADADSLLTSDGASYTAKVDLRFNNSGRKGENIAG